MEMKLRLPATVTGFSQLQYLNLDYNNLTEFPNIFSNLTNLNELNLRDNNIALLPEEFSGFLSLSSLDLSRNQLSSISSRYWFTRYASKFTAGK